MRTSRTIFMLLTIVVCSKVFAQSPSFDARQLDLLVGRVAIFEDPLLAQVLAAAGFSDQIPGAAQWADQHRNLSGQSLSNAMRSDHVRFNPSVQALLPFPGLLDHMAADMKWTTELGVAVLAEQAEVLNAIQRQRTKALSFGYLRTDSHAVVESASDIITIMPLNPAYIFVPSYKPELIFSSPGSEANVSDAIVYDRAVNIGGFRPFGWKTKRWEALGSYFQAWGWGLSGIDWTIRSLIIANVAWGRTLDNRAEYVHPYADLLAPGR